MKQQQQRCDNDDDHDGRTTFSKSSPNKKDDTGITSTSTTNTQDDSYKILAMVPRGLQDDIINQIVECHNQQDKNNNNCNDAIVEFSILDEKLYKDYGKQAFERYNEQQQLKEQRMKEHFMKNPQQDHNNNNNNKHQKKKVDITAWLQQPVGTIGLNPNLYVSFGYINEKNQQQQQQQQSIISKSKDEDEDNETNPPPSSPSNIQWTGPGQLFGSVWLQVNYSSSSTKNPSSMLSKMDSIISLRCLGPTLSLIRVGSLMNLTEAPTTTTTTTTLTLEELTKRFTAWITTTTSSSYESYRNEFQLALKIWKYHVQSSWKDQISKQDYEELQQRIHNNQIKFRVSCIREMPLGSSSSSTTTAAKKRKKKKKNKGSPATVAAVTDATTSTSTNATTAAATTQSSDFTRQNIVSSIMDSCSHLLIPGYVDDSDDKEQNEDSNIDDYRDWQVDLINYDVEVVIVLTAQMTVAIGISLQPYSYLKSKSFEAGTTPTDITPPYLGGNILSKGIVRLRPTTAHTLLHIADCRPYDIVLDPCAGIGTIPIEADKYYNNNHSNQQRNRMVGLGGDIVLHHPQITTAASVLEETAVADISSSLSSSSSSSPSSVSSSLLAAWDATYIPVRTGCVDVVLSDLPFGQQCLSASTLDQLLPLILRQCAHVLVPNTGRMVVLCGSPHAICKAMEDSCSNYWVQPCTRITPVNIGGIIAWIVRVERNEIPFQDEIDGNEEATTAAVEEKIRIRIRKVAQRRDRISEFQKSTSKNEIKKRRIVQS